MVLFGLGMTGCRFFIGNPKTGWELVGPKGFTRGGGFAKVILRCLGNGKTAIAYTESPQTPSVTKLAARIWNGSAWATAGSQEYLCDAISGGGPDMGFQMVDSGGNPIIGYKPWNSGSTNFTVTRFDGSAWNEYAAFTPPGSPVVWYVQDLALDPSGNIYLLVLQEDISPDYVLDVYELIGATWTIRPGMTIDIAGSSYDARLSFAPNGTPYVSFTDSGSGSAKYLSVWSGDPILDTLMDVPVNTNNDSVKYGVGGIPYIAPAWVSPDAPNGYFWPRVMKLSPGWMDVGTPPISHYCQTSFYSVSFNSAGTPFIAMEEDLGYTEITVFTFNGSTWAPLGRRGFTDGNSGQFPSLDVDSAGTPYLALVEVGNDDKISVYRYVGGEN
jgi:hypothetical protein